MPVATRLGLVARRGLAYLIDVALRILALCLLLLAAGGRFSPSIDGLVRFRNTDAAHFVVVVVANLAAIGGPVGFAVRFDGQTPGKMVLRLRARRVSGKPYAIGISIWREGLLKQVAPYVLPYLPFGIGAAVLIADFGWGLGAPDARMLHDYAARTYVNETRFDR